MNTLFAYQMTYCPQHTEEDPQDVRRQAYREELWQACKYLALNDWNVPLELRYVANSVSQSITAQVILYSPQDGQSSPETLMQDSFERLLPDDYGWERLSKDEIPDILEDTGFQNNACVTFERRFDFFDIDSSLWSFRNEDNTTDNQIFTIKRELLCPSPILFKSQLMTSSVCVPYLPPIESVSNGIGGFFQEMLYSSPAVVSIQLLPVQDQILSDIERIHELASFTRGALEPYHKLLNLNTGGSNKQKIPYSDVERFYSGYLQSRRSLSFLNINVIAEDASKAQSLAFALAAQHGGSRIFYISSPQKVSEVKKSVSHRVENTKQRCLEEFEQFSIDIHKKNKEYSEKAIAHGWLPLISYAPKIITQNETDFLFRLPVGTEQGLPGFSVRPYPPFASCLPKTGNEQAMKMSRKEKNTAGFIDLGEMKASKIEGSAARSNTHFIPILDLCKHALIVGSTGSGKTTTVQFLLQQIADAGVPFIVIEPSMKAEYYNKLKNHPSLKGKLRRITVGNVPESKKDEYTFPLCFDPFRLTQGLTASQHISYLKSCFQAAFPMTDTMAMLLETCLYKYYADGYFVAWRENGEVVGQSEVQKSVDKKYIVPSFNHFVSVYEDYLKELMPEDTKDTAEWTAVLKRRFDNLQLGPLGKVFKRADEKNVKDGYYSFTAEYVDTDMSSVIELNTLADREQQALVMAFFLTFLFESRQSAGLKQDILKPEHVLVIEEAHRLLGTDGAARSAENAVGESASAKAAKMFSDMLAEIRAFGQSVWIAEQIPSKIIPDAVKNTNLKFLMRLTSAEDRKYMGMSMNCTEQQQRFVNTLKTGQAVVFEEGLDQPVLLTIPNS